MIRSLVALLCFSFLIPKLVNGQQPDEFAAITAVDISGSGFYMALGNLAQSSQKIVHTVKSFPIKNLSQVEEIDGVPAFSQYKTMEKKHLGFRIKEVAFSPVHNWVYSCDKTVGHVLCHDVTSGSRIFEFLTSNTNNQSEDVGEFLMTRDGQTLISTNDTRIKTWDAATGKLIREFPNPSLRQLASSQNGKLYGITSWGTLVVVNDVRTFQVADSVQLKIKGIRDMKLSKAGDRLVIWASAGEKSYFYSVLDTRDLRELKRINTSTQYISDFAISPSATYLAEVPFMGGSPDDFLIVWDLATGEEKYGYPLEYNEDYNCMIFAPENDRLLFLLGHSINLYEINEDYGYIEQLYFSYLKNDIK